MENYGQNVRKGRWRLPAKILRLPGDVQACKGSSTSVDGYKITTKVEMKKKHSLPVTSTEP